MRIGIFITARMGSTRLCDKHLRDINDAPAISWLMTRIMREFSSEISSDSVGVWIATGDAVSNAEFNSIALAAGSSVFNGDDNNVPLRHLQAAEALKFNAIISVDGDDIFCAPEAMRAVYEALLSGASVAKTKGLPLGMNAWGYDTKTLCDALSRSPIDILETGWGRIFDDIPSLDKYFECKGADEIRATLDYQEDLIFFDQCMRNIPDWKEIPSNQFVGRILDLRLHQLNYHLSNAYWENFNMNISKEKAQLEEATSSFSDRLNSVIPGGAHTYSRGDDQYPFNAPQILEGGKGCEVWSPDGRRFLDYGMALRAVSIGYAEPEINAAAIRAIELGNNLTRASVIELEAAELLVSMIDSMDMVKFTKNGSTATSAAVKLARAYTGRELVARCAQQPFFSYDDWFIGSTPLTKGIPLGSIELTKTFEYNNIQSLEKLISEYPDQIACVILEPAALECPKTSDDQGGCCGAYPCSRFPSQTENYLQKVEKLCRKHGIIFILDEMITGFRWHMKGAQHVYGVTPDLTTFGKAMANGFSVAAVGGRREIMELGAINRPGQERLFLLSTTHGAEMSGLAAFIATMNFMGRHNVVEHLWKYGSQVVEVINQEATKLGIANHFYAAGPAVNPYFATVTDLGEPWFELRTLFAQEMIRHGILIPCMAFSYRHGERELERTKMALIEALSICALAIRDGVGKYLVGPTIKPVFRKFN
jgi:glutamate-1-semialdehyde 2,1-aminomutase